MISVLLFIGFLAWYIYGFGSDLDVSRRYVYYGKDEDNKWVLDERGQLSMKKVWIVPVIEVALAVGLGFWMHSLKPDGQWGNMGLLVPGTWLAGAGIAHFAISRKNAGDARDNRISQIARRAKWKISGVPTVLRITSRNGYYWYKPFAWIYADSPLALRAALTEWLTVPDDQAWPDKKFHPKEQ